MAQEHPVFPFDMFSSLSSMKSSDQSTPTGSQDPFAFNPRSFDIEMSQDKTTEISYQPNEVSSQVKDISIQVPEEIKPDLTSSETSDETESHTVLSAIPIHGSFAFISQTTSDPDNSMSQDTLNASFSFSASQPTVEPLRKPTSDIASEQPALKEILPKLITPAPESEETPVAPKRKRGRPKKVVAQVAPPLEKRKRGRPRTRPVEETATKPRKYTKKTRDENGKSLLHTGRPKTKAVSFMGILMQRKLARGEEVEEYIEEYPNTSEAEDSDKENQEEVPEPEPAPKPTRKLLVRQPKNVSVLRVPQALVLPPKPVPKAPVQAPVPVVKQRPGVKLRIGSKRARKVTRKNRLERILVVDLKYSQVIFVFSNAEILISAPDSLAVSPTPVVSGSTTPLSLNATHDAWVRERIERKSTLFQLFGDSTESDSLSLASQEGAPQELPTAQDFTSGYILSQEPISQVSIPDSASQTSPAPTLLAPNPMELLTPNQLELFAPESTPVSASNDQSLVTHNGEASQNPLLDTANWLAVGQTVAPRKRGRPRKYPLPATNGVSVVGAPVTNGALSVPTSNGVVEGTSAQISGPVAPFPRKRGRPRIHPIGYIPAKAVKTGSGRPGRPPGRPRKHPLPVSALLSTTNIGHPLRAIRSRQSLYFTAASKTLPNLPGLFKSDNGYVQFSRGYLKDIMAPGLKDVPK
ncbi:hypothetical protein BABINDRAFT_160666 [Babjeviella inositovora NRRL Y-12698]|uniref:Uncharacterized protein n=1 Tax=Babjeviella inositovora NRRL Y-12698 TaxID=984486 RepID=A0A1E3QUQ9_9ASCO|nr:uncharacterized protein BABINDRAFT_160666 [Babjeviella inositovora NRRL Y-12698]ODQ81304.1 hypothetical protein BABINDRAFT_160666 [Babjeviella inositovora NRRL Y-12698]